jgi:hypothetical protein
MSNTAKNIIVILGLITVGFAGYFMYMQQSATTLSFNANEDVLRNMRTNSVLFIERRGQLEAVDMDLSFFSDERVLSFRSFEEPIQEQPIGRSNPFATVVPLATDE